jgi:hypothetical protein
MPASTPDYCGSVFSLRPGNGGTDWASRALWDFGGYADEDTPIAGLLSTTGRISGKTTLFGTTTRSLYGYDGSVFTLVGKTLTAIWSFSYGDGNFPYGGVIAEQNGALYATTIEGGTNYCGTVVQLVPPAQGQTAWTENVLWNFAGGSTDGCSPYSTLIADASGALYGTTLYGDGAGGVFKLTPPAQGQTAWTEQMLYGFTGGADGGNAFSTLTFGANGVLYGTTAVGGNGSGGGGSGVVFQLTPPAQGQTAWTEQVLWTFSGGADGAAPLFGALLVDTNGALYGTASGGGAARKCAGFGAFGGSVFKLSPSNGNQTPWSETTLLDFDGGPAGCIPDAGLVADNTGALYGTTQYGGSYHGPACDSSGCGTAFRLTGTGYAPKASRPLEKGRRK